MCMDFLSIQLKIRIIGYQNISLIFTVNLQQNRFPIIIYIHSSPHIRIKTGVFYLYVQSFNHTHENCFIAQVFWQGALF